MTSEILAQVIRGETVESIHRGHFIVIDGDGQTVASMGDPQAVTFFRSACKAFQAIPFITSGAADAFSFTEDEIALAVIAEIQAVLTGRLGGMLRKRERPLHEERHGVDVITVSGTIQGALSCGYAY